MSLKIAYKAVFVHYYRYFDYSVFLPFWVSDESTNKRRFAR